MVRSRIVFWCIRVRITCCESSAREVSLSLSHSFLGPRGSSGAPSRGSYRIATHCHKTSQLGSTRCARGRNTESQRAWNMTNETKANQLILKSCLPLVQTRQTAFEGDILTEILTGQKTIVYSITISLVLRLSHKLEILMMIYCFGD